MAEMDVDSGSEGLTQEDYDEENFDENVELDLEGFEGENELEGNEGNIPDHSTVVSSLDGGAVIDPVKKIGSASDFFMQSQSAANKPKRDRSNAKPVECYDLQGNLLKIFNSGTLAARELNIQQGDISLCCRGLKSSVNGFKFKFSGASSLVDRPEGMKLKRGFAFVPVTEEGNIETGINVGNKSEVTLRTTRASRGEYSSGSTRGHASDKHGKQLLLAPPSIRVRTWRQEVVQRGPFHLTKWIPNSALPTEALLAHKPKHERKRRGGGRKSLGYIN
jgi:hypothetical protein